MPLGDGHGTDSFVYEGTSFVAQNVTGGRCADVFGGANVILGAFTRTYTLVPTVDPTCIASGSFLDTVSDQFEDLIGNLSDMLNGLGG